MVELPLPAVDDAQAMVHAHGRSAGYIAANDKDKDGILDSVDWAYPGKQWGAP